MKAVRFHRRGGPEVLRVDDVPDPLPGPDEVLVDVRAVGLNHLDLLVRRGLPIPIEMPHIGGVEFAGVVRRLGPGAAGVAEGDRVVSYPVLAAGGEPFPRCGDPPRGPLTILGEQRNGACCEALALPSANLLALPEGLSFEDAAAAPVAFLTAWEMLIERARVQPGETLLVLGASSGVGSAAIQIGNLAGARVLACSSRPEWLERARQLGAEEVIDRCQEPIGRGVLRRTRGVGADVVVEHVGAATWGESLLACAFGGRIVTCGATTGRIARTDLPLVFGKQLSILGVTLGSRRSLAHVLDLVAQGRLRPVVDRVLPLDACRRGHEVLEAGEAFGKVVLRVPPAS